MTVREALWAARAVYDQMPACDGECWCVRRAFSRSARFDPHLATAARRAYRDAEGWPSVASLFGVHGSHDRDVAQETFTSALRAVDLAASAA